MTPDLAWKYREGRRRRYEGKRVGGTVVVHFIKKNMWFLETAAALLHGDNVTPLERALEQRPTHTGEDDGESGLPPLGERAEGAGTADSSSASTDADVDLTSATATTRESTRTLIRRVRGDRGQ